MRSLDSVVRKAEAQQIIRNSLRRLEQLLEEEHPLVLKHAMSAVGIAHTSELSLAEFDRLLSYVRQQVPGVTLQLFSKLSLMDLGLVGYAAARAGTVGEALRIVNNYHELTSDRFRPVFEVEWELARILPVAKIGFADELIDIAEDNLAGTWNLLRQLMGSKACSKEIKVKFSYQRPDYDHWYRKIFGKEVEFGAERTEMLFPSAWLNIPVSVSNPDISGIFSVVCEQLLGPPSHQADIVSSVRTLLMSRQGRTMPSIEEAASLLNMSIDQLRKRLWRQGCSFKALVLETRMMLGINYLEATSFSIQEIAYLLGYNHSGAFSRAFKRYYGVAPVSIRGQ